MGRGLFGDKGLAASKLEIFFAGDVVVRPTSVRSRGGGGWGGATTTIFSGFQAAQ